MAGERPFLAPDHEADRATKVGAAVVLRRLSLGPHHPNPSEAERRELIGEVLHAGDEKVLHGASARLDRGGREGAEPRVAIRMPCTPTASALRIRLPKFCGSSTPSSAKMKGPHHD